jgi:hypothetical protein
MMIEEALFARLTAPDSQTTALVAKRVHPSYIPDDAMLPAIMYERKPDSRQTKYNIDGQIDHVEAAYRIHCFAGQEDIATAQAIAAAVTADLDQYRAALDGITIINGWHNDTWNNYDGTNKRQRVSVEIEFWYRAT